MTSILRQIVASPRVRHPEANLDLCYVTDNIIATSGPSDSYPKVAYRNPLKGLVKFLDEKHGEDWAIWEFRAEGTGYPDEAVYNRIHHYPWPDHHPPPFNLVPLILGSMRNWLEGPDAEGRNRVVVVHCKAGKGRSGTTACSYLISEEGWKPEDAMQRFTERRMRPGFGNGISIPSQRRTIDYVTRWTANGKKYVERPSEVVEIHIWGLKDGVKVAVEGFEQEGKVIKTMHTFTSAERNVVRGSIKDSGVQDLAMEMLGRKKEPEQQTWNRDLQRAPTGETLEAEQQSDTGDVVFKPSSPIRIPTCDICIDFERRNKTKIGGFTMVTAVAHVWFNTFFEGNGPENHGIPDETGVFEIQWDALDGLKGSARKGVRAFDKLAVVWKAVPTQGEEIKEPEIGEVAKQTQPADWRTADDEQSQDFEKKLGLRAATTESADVSRAESMHDSTASKETVEEMNGIQDLIPDGEDIKK